MAAASVVVCAHRGNSSAFPENTLPAFRSAVELGTDMIEFDVCSTRDGYSVLCHDATVDRTTDGAGRVEDLTVTQIRRLDAGSWKGPEFAGTRMPTLAEALDDLPTGMLLNIHVKPDALDMERLLQDVTGEIRRRRLYDTAFIASEAAEIRRIHDLDPQIRTCCLSGQTSKGYIEFSASLGCRILQPGHELTTSEFVRRAHDRGMTVNVFYADTEEEMTRLIDCGADGILTNYPARLLRLLHRT